MISVKTFVFNPFQVNTFVLSDETGEAVIIDPACNDSFEFESLYNYISDNNLKPVKIINTHGHVDHVCGINKVAKHYNITPHINKEDSFLLQTAIESGAVFGFVIEELPQVNSFIEENDIISFGNSSLKAIHVPGHSPGSLVYYAKEDNFIVAGDVLFNGSIGRSDLPGGNHDTLIEGIKSKLLTLPGDTLVFCGHGPKTSIQKEHDTNPFLS